VRKLEAISIAYRKESSWKTSCLCLEFGIFLIHVLL